MRVLVSLPFIVLALACGIPKEQFNAQVLEAREQLEKKSSEYESLAQSLKVEIDAGKIELSELKGRLKVSSPAGAGSGEP